MDRARPPPCGSERRQALEPPPRGHLAACSPPAVKGAYGIPSGPTEARPLTAWPSPATPHREPSGTEATSELRCYFEPSGTKATSELRCYFE